MRRREGGQGVWDPNAMEVDRGWGGDEDVLTAGCSGIWSDIAEIKRRSGEGHRRCQKIRETSKPLAGLP